MSVQHTRQVGVIGYPISHSISPIFQQAAFDQLGLAIRYERWETPPDQLATRISGIRAGDGLGANVTVPHKETVVPLLDNIDELALRIGAVNTIVNRQGVLSGYNTDARGFIRACHTDGNLELKNKRVLILGAGGAARAVAFGLLDEAVKSLTVCNRTQARAEALAEALIHDAYAAPTEITVLPWGSDSGKPEIIVNTTNIGMAGGENSDASPLDPLQMEPGMVVCDLVYNPVETRLIKLAKEAGAQVLTGLPMLIYQGAASFEIWTGREAPINVMFNATKHLL
ncbi:shikimate dehydrogenase [Dehalococcoidia bacterium]|nr:shikimate dehydrogenase [Dehalococcoidia bacterium]